MECMRVYVFEAKNHELYVQRGQRVPLRRLSCVLGTKTSSCYHGSLHSTEK